MTISKSKKIQLVEDAKKLASDDSVISFFEYGLEEQKSAKETVVNTLVIELTLCKTLIACSGYLSLALHANKGGERIFPKDWLDAEEIVNADVIMSCVLCQLSNYAYSVVELVLKGLDTPARALLRSTSDLGYILAVLASDREAFKSYALDKESNPKELWYNLFSARKLASRMSGIDAKLELSTEWTNFMRKFREENGGFFSEAVHHSPTAILIGALPRIGDTDRVELALLGGYPAASRMTLGYLATSINYGLTYFLRGRPQFNGFVSKCSNPELWEIGVSLHERTQPIFLNWLSENK